MVLAGASFEILGQLINLLEQMNDEEYCQPLNIISKNTIGKHVRHIVEFYEEMLKGYDKGFIDYDARLRNTRLETERAFAVTSLNSINNKLFTIKADVPLRLAVSVGLTDDKYEIDTTIYREIAYNIEHTIHHFAIIKIAIDIAFDDISLPDNFGIAYSTIKHHQAICAQ